jgi:hypothetical protein
LISEEKRENPAEYRWSSYGEAIGGGTKGNGKQRKQAWFEL